MPKFGIQETHAAHASYHHADHRDHNHHCDDFFVSDQLSSPADSFTAAWRAQADPDPAPGIRGVCDHQASGTDSFDDLCDEWEGKALHRLVWRFSSAASKGHRYGSQRHVRLTLRDTLCGPKLCGPKLQ
jgi:hypothetical protein